MKTYAILGPRSGIMGVIETDKPRDGLSELTSEQLAAYEALKEGARLFLINGTVTTLEEFAGEGNRAHFDQETKTWEVVSRPPAPVPKVLANWRVKAVLDAQGLTATVNDAIDALPEGLEKIVVSRAWYGNGDVFRHSPTVVSLAQALSLTEEQVDEMFRMGATFNP